ncbi:putative 3-methyladenine DNA glycosylase/8-oxoguanine DNA glycosylase [Candidatus Zixiibacteriota bacterium]|nr:putative 3-methyladenine DNA glycosylase/8-oxoguanine DNA glycosylase [candidate division Zixibacteria bacterium]
MPEDSFPVIAPYNFELSLKFSQHSRFEITDNTAGGHLRRLVNIGSEPVLMEIWCEGSVERPLGRVSWTNLGYKRIPSTGVKASAARMLCSDLDLKPFYSLARRSRAIRRLIEEFRGLKLILTTTLYEATAWAVMGQQVNLKFASTLKTRLVKKYGKGISHKGVIYYQFPEPHDLSGVSVSELQSLQFSRRKAEYITGLTRTFLDNRLSAPILSEMTLEDAITHLQSIRGIGPWSANYIMMRGSGHPNCLPIGDSGLHRAVQNNYKLTEKPENKLVEKLAEPFTPYRSLYTLYLWYSLTKEKVKI